MAARVSVAYELLRAIGSGATATPEDTKEICAAIRDEVGRLVGQETAAMLRTQYGGSVIPETAAALLGAANVDGFLVGGASLDREQFAAIVLG